MDPKDIQQLQERIKYLENQIEYYQALLKKI